MSAFDIVERTTIPAILGSLPGIQFARTKNDSIERESVYIMDVHCTGIKSIRTLNFWRAAVDVLLVTVTRPRTCEM